MLLKTGQSDLWKQAGWDRAGKGPSKEAVLLAQARAKGSLDLLVHQ